MTVDTDLTPPLPHAPVHAALAPRGPVRVAFDVGPVRSKKLYAIIWPGPVRQRRDTPTPGPGRRPRIHPNERSPIHVFILQDNQEFDLAVQLVDAAGNPVPLGDGDAIAFASSDESVLVVADHGDGTATATATGKLGTAQVQATDTETDGDTIRETLDVQIVTGPATSVTITPGEPRDASNPPPETPVEPAP